MPSPNENKRVRIITYFSPHAPVVRTPNVHKAPQAQLVQRPKADRNQHVRTQRYASAELSASGSQIFGIVYCLCLNIWASRTGKRWHNWAANQLNEESTQA